MGSYQCSTIGPMEYGPIEHFQTGVAAAVSALRTRDSLGCGEFLDLVELGRWCKSVGMDLIQILPVNDSGSDASPYAALSAFALHPIYVRLTAVAGAEDMATEFQAALEPLENTDRLEYEAVLETKLRLLRIVFDRGHEPHAIDEWMRQRAWGRTYCVFRTLSQVHHGRAFWDWPQTDLSAALVEETMSSHAADVRFFAWVQIQLENQLLAASRSLMEMGVRLKGDLPILLNENSADVWEHPELFDREWKAGAPPDMFAHDGQNWGFPSYRWDKLARDDYRWWRERLQHADRFYHAFRLDHVLGFFRLWRIPKGEETGLMGQFHPSVPLQVEHFTDQGFSAEQVHEFAQAREDAYDRLLLPHASHADGFRPFWHFSEARRFQDMEESQQNAFRRVIEQDEARQQESWANHGREILTMVTGTTNMLVCAEDLGAVPNCVPEVLNELNILGLRVERWQRRWDDTGSPFKPPEDYERLTVCSPSGHDTSTLRGWWQENEDERRAYIEAAGLDHDAHGRETLDRETLGRIIQRNLASNSLLCIFALQDLLNLVDGLGHDDPAAERVNVPGTPSNGNWRYRMRVPVHEVSAHETLRKKLNKWLGRRRERSIEPA